MFYLLYFSQRRDGDPAVHFHVGELCLPSATAAREAWLRAFICFEAFTGKRLGGALDREPPGASKDETYCESVSLEFPSAL